MSYSGGGGPELGEGALYSEVQCIMGNCHMGTPSVDRMTYYRTDTTENITFP